MHCILILNYCRYTYNNLESKYSARVLVTLIYFRQQYYAKNASADITAASYASGPTEHRNFKIFYSCSLQFHIHKKTTLIFSCHYKQHLLAARYYLFIVYTYVASASEGGKRICTMVTTYVLLSSPESSAKISLHVP